jgi:hypothetical protein
MENIKEINPFKEQNIELLEQTPADNERFGASNLSGVKELQVGWGSEVFRSDESGIWLGKKTFAEASHPTTGTFAVDMQGNITAPTLTLSGYVQVGGSASDINSNATTISGGKITTGSITTDKLIAGTITGFTITGTTITGGTITGTTIKTQSSGQRIELSSSFMGFYDSSNNNTATMYAGSNSVKIQYGNSSTVIQLDCGTSGAITFMSGGNQRFLYSDSQNALYPYSNSSIDIGVYARSWKDLWLNSVGSVGASGTQGASFPSGWSVSKIATGRYQVTHNYNSYDYVVNVTVVSSVAKIWSVEVKSNNSFNVRIANTSFTLEDNDFDFIVIRN